MKKIYNSEKIRLSSVIMMMLMICGISINSFALEDDTMNMSPGYANDVYYSMANGTVATVVRDNWDIAFSSQAFSASILINDGSGVELYAYPNGDTGAWATLDTAGMSQWKPLYNTEESWEEGAFNVNASAHPDYGWGKYNQVTHNVTGDSLFIIKTLSGNYKKLWIVKKESLAVKYTFKYANLDGSSEEDVILDASAYGDKNFYYYSFASDMAIDREPPSDSWDLLLTKYMAIHPTGAPVIVTGVFINYKTYVSKNEPVSQLLYNDWTQLPLDSAKTMIGWNWKEFNFSALSYVVDDSVVFFITNTSGDIYKLYFTKFEGTTTGITLLKKELVSAASIGEIMAEDREFSVYPNPSNGILEFDMENFEKTEIAVYDMVGNLLYNTTTRESIRIDLGNMAPGTYLMLIKQDEKYYSEKLIIR